MNSATFFGKAIDDLEIGGYHVPKGWGMIGAIHINMRNPDVFDDPDTFDPERFTPEREAALAPGSYVPHGAGERNHHRCPGEDMVTIAVKIYLTLLLRKVDWTIPAQDLTLTNELFPLPASGLKVSFTPLGAKVGS
jgi:cytochrome P450